MSTFAKKIVTTTAFYEHFFDSQCSKFAKTAAETSRAH